METSTIKTSILENSISWRYSLFILFSETSKRGWISMKSMKLVCIYHTNTQLSILAFTDLKPKMTAQLIVLLTFFLLKWLKNKYHTTQI